MTTDHEPKELYPTAESIIIDAEQWNENGGSTSDDIYRILLDDGVAVDFYYSNGLHVEAECGHVYPNGGRNGIQFSIRDAMMTANYGYIVIKAFGNTRVDIDCQRIVSTGVIPWDMSLHGSRPRTIQ